MSASPRLYLVARPTFDVDAFLSFLESEKAIWLRTDDVSDSEEIVEAAGRICYMSFGERQSPRTNPEYLQNLVRLGHESVLEHVSWSFVLAGVSRAFTHQLVRHRVGFSFSQLSQQYRDQGDVEPVRPAAVDLDERVAAVWEDAMSTTRAAYREILSFLETDDGLPLPAEKRERVRAIRSAARSVLPEATESVIFMTVNARAARHFLNVRGAIRGDEEMRVVSAAMLSMLAREAPGLFSDFSLEVADDGLPLVAQRPFGG
ncbi:MAG: thymidylate synthase [Gaiellaceae bacterium]|nr:thymidylate synthase [Gaiellaceae bacterium]